MLTHQDHQARMKTFMSPPYTTLLDTRLANWFRGKRIKRREGRNDFAGQERRYVWKE